MDAQSNTQGQNRAQRRDERRDSLRDTFTGWDRLAERTISANGNDQALTVGTSQRTYDRLRLQVNGRTLVVRDVVVTMADGSTYRPESAFTFSASNAMHEIDLPGSAANVARIEFDASDLPSGQNAQLEVWGR